MADKFLSYMINHNKIIALQSFQIALKKLSRNSGALNLNNINNLNLRLSVINCLIKRLTKWPSSIDIDSFTLSNNKVTLKSEKDNDNNFLKAQLVSVNIDNNYNIPMHVWSSYHSIVANNNFPCPELSFPGRSISPFTQTIRSNGREIIYLSSIAYFEVKIEPSYRIGLILISYILKNIYANNFFCF